MWPTISATEVSVILDGGACAVGVESTVIDLTSETPTILRPGGVTIEDIGEALNRRIDVASTNEQNPKSPGMLLSHYAPSLPVRLNASWAEDDEAFLGFGPSPYADLNLSEHRDLTEAAANLFAYLHKLDDIARYYDIAVMPIPEEGLGRAINDRLRRAAARRD